MFVSSRWSPMGSNSNAGCDESFKHRLSGTGGKHGAPWSETRSVVGHELKRRPVGIMGALPMEADIPPPSRSLSPKGGEEHNEEVMSHERAWRPAVRQDVQLTGSSTTTGISRSGTFFW